jgi:hypothetical protein
MTNGAKVYICSLISNPDKKVEIILKELEKISGRIIVGYKTSLLLLIQLVK